MSKLRQGNSGPQGTTSQSTGCVGFGVPIKTMKKEGFLYKPYSPIEIWVSYSHQKMKVVGSHGITVITGVFTFPPWNAEQTMTRGLQRQPKKSLCLSRSIHLEIYVCIYIYIIYIYMQKYIYIYNLTWICLRLPSRDVLPAHKSQGIGHTFVTLWICRHAYPSVSRAISVKRGVRPISFWRTGFDGCFWVREWTWSVKRCQKWS